MLSVCVSPCIHVVVATLRLPPRFPGLGGSFLPIALLEGAFPNTQKEKRETLFASSRRAPALKLKRAYCRTGFFASFRCNVCRCMLIARAVAKKILPLFSVPLFSASAR